MRTIEIEVEPDYLRELATSRGDENAYTEVVMVLPRPQNKVLLITKSFYPPNTFRMPSGRMKPGEDPKEAFQREVNEETGLNSKPVATIETMIIRCKAENERLDITSHVILGSLTSADPKPNDEDENISAYREIEAHQLYEIAERLSSLTGRWQGWGLFRAPAHRVAADYLINQKVGH